MAGISLRSGSSISGFVKVGEGSAGSGLLLWLLLLAMGGRAVVEEASWYMASITWSVPILFSVDVRRHADWSRPPPYLQLPEFGL